MKPDNEIFGSANAYEAYVGRWSRPVAQQFIAWVNAPAGCDWLDVGAGTGVLTQVILENSAPSRVIGIDYSADYIAYARERVHDPRAVFSVGDAADTIFDPPKVDVSVAGLVLNFVPDARAAVVNMMQAVRDGGIVAAYVWDYGGRMEMMRHFWDAATLIDPAAAEMDSGPRFTICRPENLQALFQSVGLESVDVTAIDVETRFVDFDDYWLPFLGAQGSIAKYFHGLSDETRIAIREQLRMQLPTADDGTISLIARAWAVKGMKTAG